MLKRFVLAMVVLGLVFGGVCGVAFAEQKVEFPELSIASIREGPPDVPRVVESQVNFWAEVIAGLIRTGGPFAVFGEEEAFGLVVTAKEKLLWDKLDLVAGFTFKNEERGKFVTGIQYTGLADFEAEIWQIFERFEPTLYLIEGEWCLGIRYEFRAG